MEIPYIFLVHIGFYFDFLVALKIMHVSFIKALALAALMQTSVGAPAGADNLDPRKLNVVKTTTTETGQVIDWIAPESQGKIASPPPLSMLKRPPSAAQAAIVEAIKPKEAGPPGTVPVLRKTGPTSPMKRLPRPGDFNSTSNAAAVDAGASASANHPEARDGSAGVHWYSSTAQAVNNFGGSATYSLYKAFVQSPDDFSLLQVAVVRDSAAQADGSLKTQTVESGWINYPRQVSQPHLFTFYTTNGYEAYGDNICGWNTEYRGWVQVDGDIYPGVPFAPLSVVGGQQYEAEIHYLLYQGNWWLSVLGKYIGYYPGSLFSQGGVNPADTLGGYSDRINFYGEIFNSETSLTTTDMGSGEFAAGGPGRAAYLHNIQYYDTSSTPRNYDGGRDVQVSDPNRYSIATSFNSDTSWSSYFYLGGPGAGGQIGA